MAACKWNRQKQGQMEQEKEKKKESRSVMSFRATKENTWFRIRSSFPFILLAHLVTCCHIKAMMNVQVHYYVANSTGDMSTSRTNVWAITWCVALIIRCTNFSIRRLAKKKTEMKMLSICIRWKEIEREGERETESIHFSDCEQTSNKTNCYNNLN